MTVSEDMLNRCYKRRGRYRHFEEDQLPEPEALAEPCVAGTYSVVTFSSLRRFVLKPYCIRLADDIIETPPTIARDYLTTVFKKSPHIKHTQAVALQRRLRPAPLLVDPGDYDEGWYLDIDQCFWSIMMRYGWNVDYNPPLWLARGRPPFDFPFPERAVARNCLVSACRIVSFEIWTPEGEKTVRKGNHLANFQLLGLVSDILHSIASVAKRAGAVYIGTDGYILRDAKSLRTVAQAVEDFGLSCSVRAHGKTSIVGPGCYRVGRKKTRVFLDHPVRYDNIARVEDSKWLAKSIAQLHA